MDGDFASRPHQQIPQLSLGEKKFLLAVERGDVASSRRYTRFFDNAEKCSKSLDLYLLARMHKTCKESSHFCNQISFLNYPILNISKSIRVLFT